MSEITVTLLIHVDAGPEAEEKMARDIRRVLASRKALKRLLNAITVIKVHGPRMTPQEGAEEARRQSRPDDVT